MRIEARRFDELLARFRERTLLVVGDLMLDRYVIGKVSRISPEAPVPVIRVTREKSAPGGASNVARNVRFLGGKVVVSGVVGCDAAGTELNEVLNAEGIGTEGVVFDPSLVTTVKTRIVAERQQVARVDHEGPAELTDAIRADLCRRIEALAGDVDGVVIEDYGKGVVSQALVDAIMPLCRRLKLPVAMDPKHGHPLRIEGLTLATPNYREALDHAGLPEPLAEREPGADGLLERAGEILSAAWQTDLLMITLGPHGMYLRSRDGSCRRQPTRAREVYDVQGAGDTVIATAMLALVAGATHDEAATLSNCAAGVVVGKLGTATCSPDELRASLAWVEG